MSINILIIPYESIPLLLFFWIAPSASHQSCSALQQSRPDHPGSKTTLVVCTTSGTESFCLLLIRKKRHEWLKKCTSLCYCQHASQPEQGIKLRQWEIHSWVMLCLFSQSAIIFKGKDTVNKHRLYKSIEEFCFKARHFSKKIILFIYWSIVWVWALSLFFKFTKI